MRDKQKSVGGLTLMEITVVLAIMSIIALVLVPIFLNSTDRARLRADVQSALVLQNAMDLYRVERGRYRDFSSGNMDEVLGILVEAGYINPRNVSIQTEGAKWVIEGGNVMVDIGGSPDEVHGAVGSLSEAELELVKGWRR
ncbi:MAG: type II secretion system GspH family protein [Defluviitaleaceae bacterium]|nr:type II secretion system GspH family protein [Defluviitaleaceae bacterium]